MHAGSWGFESLRLHQNQETDMRCQTAVDVFVSHAKIIRKKRLNFHYGFTAKGDRLQLRIFWIDTTSRFLEFQTGRESRTVVLVSSGMCHNYTRDPVERLLFPIPEFKKIKSLSDVEIPDAVWKAARRRLKRLKV